MVSKSLVYVSFSLILAVSSFSYGDDNAKLAKRSMAAAQDLKEIVGAPDKSAPLSLLTRATCIVAIPDVKKAGFGVGGQYGRGLASCRQGNGWSAPEFVFISGGSFGLQIGVASVDLVLIFVRPNASQRLSGGNFTIGGDATVAAGPVGRDLQAGTDYQLNSEIFAYARARGVFGGIVISGSVLKPDQSADDTAYGPGHTPAEILAAPGSSASADVVSFVNSLNANIPK